MIPDRHYPDKPMTCEDYIHIYCSWCQRFDAPCPFDGNVTDCDEEIEAERRYQKARGDR